MNFLEFVEKQNQLAVDKVVINEAFKNDDVTKAHDLMLGIFKKKIGAGVLPFGSFETRISGKSFYSWAFVNFENKVVKGMFTLNYLVSSKSSEVYSISLFDEKSTIDFLWSDHDVTKASLNISTLGTSVACFIPIICHVMKNNDFDLSEEKATDIAKTIYKGKANESRTYSYGALDYTIFENFTDEMIEEAFYLALGYEKVIDEASQAMEYRWEKKKERDEAYMNRTKSTADRARYELIQAEYQKIVDAIRGGAQTISDIKMALQKEVKVQTVSDSKTQEAEKKFDEQTKDPKRAFKEMQVYVKTVLKGMQPGVILCGAPGIGKTYRILQQLKAAGYHDGHNMCIIKGKCTTRSLYLSLYEYRDKGNILVIDDADALVGPKAPEDCINILKAALDSTSAEEGRKVSYRIAGKLMDDEGVDIPKTMYYNGGVIVITNYNVGQLDTALRGRVFTQSLDFSTEQLLSIIEEIMPAIDPEHLTLTSKKKAYAYLQELAKSGQNMEISIRTFGTCARLFTVCEDDPDMSDDDVMLMIKEQMANQAIRGGKKY